jgi:transcription factor SPN1
MEAAYLADNENNQRGKTAVNKLRVIEKVLLKIKTPQFATYFLNKGGLEQFNNFLKRLPDGSWPLSQVRSEILHCILSLQCNEHHLKYTKLGKTLSTLQKSTHEYEENKKTIKEIKDKWSRVVSGINMEYYNLESYEKENIELMRKKKKKSTAQVFF